MGSRRTLITIAAVLVGALAVFMIYGYVGSVKDEAFGEAERVEVFVVKDSVPKGTYGEETTTAGTIAPDQIPKKFLPENAIRSIDDIAGKVAVGDLAVNQVVTIDMFADPSTVQTTFSDRLEKINGVDQVAVSIQVDQVRGVAGLLQPGDYVNVMATDVCEVDDTAPDPEQAAEPEVEGEEPTNGSCRYNEELLLTNQARYVYQKAQILAIDQTPVQLPGEASAATAEGDAAAAAPVASGGLITLIVPARAAQVISSIQPDRFFLNLVPRDYEPVPQEAIDPTQPLPGEDPEQLTPYGPDGPGGE